MSNHSLHSHYRATIQQYYYFQSEGMADTDEIGREFDQFIAQVEAAAEQLGAIKALRDAAESPDLIGHMYREYDEHPLRSTLAPAAVRATATYLHNRADQEGDDGQS